MTRLKTRLATLALMGRAPLCQPALLLRRPAYLLVLSHMRGHTSLLAHILGSHPEINGHSELGIAYRHSLDLWKLRCKVCLDNPGKREGRYVLDKVLHNDLAISESILARPDVRLIFLLREAAPTLKSLLDLGARQEPGNWKRDPRRVTDYYCTRLAQLGAALGRLGTLGEAAASRAFFLRAEDLIANPEAVLERLSAWLKLGSPLQSEYRVFESTGRPGMGDPVGHIKAGRILAESGRHADIALDPALEARAREAHARFALAAETAESDPWPQAGLLDLAGGRP